MPSRRDVLATAGILAAGGGFLNEAISREDNPAAQVEDRSSTIRITAVRTPLVSPTVYVKVALPSLGRE